MIILWIFAVFASIVTAKLLTPDDNQLLQESCGLPHGNQYQDVLKGLNTEQSKNTEGPWSVSLAFIGPSGWKSPFCSGTLISDYHVLTAAHCIYPLDMELNAETGLYQRMYRKIENITIIIDDDCGGNTMNCVLNPIYEGQPTRAFVPVDYYRNERLSHLSQYADVAIFELAKKVPLTTDTYPARVSGRNPDINMTLTHFGYGKDEKDLFGNKKTGKLQKLETEVVECNDISSLFTPALDHFCTSSEQHPCAGDSGGGFVTELGKKKTVFGIVSWGDDCANMATQLDKLDHNTAIAPHIRWICEMTGICVSDSKVEQYSGKIHIVEQNSTTSAI